MMMMNYKVWKT